MKGFWARRKATFARSRFSREIEQQSQMHLALSTRLLLALALGIALALAFPNFNVPIVAWFAVALLIVASVGASGRVGALCGFLQAHGNSKAR